MRELYQNRKQYIFREEKGIWDYGYNEEAIVNLRDSLPGIIKGQNKSGLYIDLNIENDFDDCKGLVPVFGYWTGKGGESRMRYSDKDCIVIGFDDDCVHLPLSF